MSLAQSVARAILPRPVRNWLRNPAVSVRRLADELQHRAGLDPLVTIRPGFALRCHPAAWRGAYHVHLDDPPQVAELDAFLATCRPGMRLFDLGAHYGMFSLAAAHAGGTAVAVDPSAHALAMTQQVARRNQLDDRITLVQAAAAATPGAIEMVSTGVQAMGYFVQPDASHGPRERTRVETVSVDSLADKLGAPSHLKIDVEGFEADALAGATRTLETAHPLVLLELHVAIMRQAGKDPGAPLDLLARHGYAFRTSDGAAATREALSRESLVRFVAVPQNPA